MRAVIVNQYGATPVVAEVPTPVPGPGEILIRLRAAGMNPMDRLIADGGWSSAMPATFPMVLGADGAGVVEKIGKSAKRFAIGDQVFGQLLIAPLGSTGTYAELVAVTEDAPLALVPDGLDPVVAAALPTAGMTGLSLVESLEPLDGKTLLIVGATGGVGSFATQLAAHAGARVSVTAQPAEADRMCGYGAVETFDHTAGSLPDAVRKAHPDGIDALIDLASDADAFAALASQVRAGGTAVTTKYVADVEDLVTGGVKGINFALPASSELLKRVAGALVAGQFQAPPITLISLEEAPAVVAGTSRRPADGKTVITLEDA